MFQLQRGACYNSTNSVTDIEICTYERNNCRFAPFNIHFTSFSEGISSKKSYFHLCCLGFRFLLKNIFLKKSWKSLFLYFLNQVSKLENTNLYHPIFLLNDVKRKYTIARSYAHISIFFTPFFYFKYVCFSRKGSHVITHHIRW